MVKSRALTDNFNNENGYKRSIYQVMSYCLKMVAIATAVRLFLVLSTTITHLVHCNPVDDSQIGGRIVGGQIIDISQAPYQVSIKGRFNGFHFCGGSIISLKHILSAAHCLL